MSYIPETNQLLKPELGWPLTKAPDTIYKKHIHLDLKIKFFFIYVLLCSVVLFSFKSNYHCHLQILFQLPGFPMESTQNVPLLLLSPCLKYLHKQSKQENKINQFMKTTEIKRKEKKWEVELLRMKMLFKNACVSSRL